ncbi:MAG: insulinase family protein [Candidatus Marinimicrobia bacterium]|nr:insulinase family protein [Candidatus Neomarinimicrobiota bacterium]MCF7850227.1 insulinase family protein [Candidatus Neomarinimicrobiota bacterium]MCF7903731.1 insulinase family protein [Candidatus Neomarinimicrobiota bacterium]
MFRSFPTLILIVSLVFLTSCVFINQSEDTGLDLDKTVPLDPALVQGELENGLKYFIKENAKPENRAELRLVINAGSILEAEDQRGLAHLLEHMCFNGTEDFPKMDLINYLESIGMRFGPDLNAYTSFDETVYMLQVPTDSVNQLNTAFQILENWAHKVSLEGEEIDLERGVVIEEWRLGQGAGQRMFDKQLPIIFKGSRYAVRLPIGSMDVIGNASYETIRRFYRDWYRPDLMAVVAVGDFDAKEIEAKIQDLFSALPATENKPERETYDVPGHEETLYALASDAEATQSSVSILYKHPSKIDRTVGDFQASIVEQLYHEMLNARFNEISQKADAPFLYAYSGKTAWARTSELVTLGAGVAEGGIEKGLEAILIEAERVRQHGFTTSELDRAKKDILRSMEKYYQERDKMDSRGFASELIRHFLEEEAVPGIENEYMLYKELIPGIAVAEVNSLAQTFITNENRVVMASSPEKEGLINPTKADLAAVLAAISELEIEPYVDKVITEPLLSDLPQAGSVVSEKHYDDIDVDELILSNGVRVVLKATDFKNDEIVFQAFSPGGFSLVPDEDLVSAKLAATLMDYSGLGQFSLVDIQKMLAGKSLGSTPYINALHEGLKGSASPEDLELLFQMIYLQFTSSRLDQEAIGSLMKQFQAQLENKSLSPESAYNDTLSVTVNNYHPRRKPFTVDMLGQIDPVKAQAIYDDRFADAGDFTFLFVGNFSREQIMPFITQYLGALPSTDRNESWRDEHIVTPTGKIKKSVNRGVEPKSRTMIKFTGEFDYSRQNRYDMYSMMKILNIRLREVLREDMGGVYGVSVWSSVSKYPTPEYSLNVTFGCDPERVDELTQAVLAEINTLRTELPEQANVDKVKESQRREREINIKRNGYWLNSLAVYYRENRDLADFMKFNELIEGFSAEAAQQAAQRYFDMDNMIQVTLYPEN